MKFLSVILLCIRFIGSVVNIKNDGEIWYCNSNPLDRVNISSLSDTDLERINKLEQIQVMTRHGTRVSHSDLQDYFPNNTQYYHCNISTITSRQQTPLNEYFIPMLKTYEDDNELLLHSNCEYEQSLPILLHQQQQNAQILINAYMKSNSKSQLFNINETMNKTSPLNT